MSLTKLLLSVGCLAVALAASPAVRAQECKTSVDCRKGFTCVIVPSAEPTRGASPACTQADCPVVSSPPAVDAGTVEPTGYCALAPCTTADDCGPNMICHTETYPECTGGASPACPPNTKCDAGPTTPPTCTTKSVSTCGYKWQLQCNVDTDCGAGFTCMPSVSVGCSGGGSAGTSGTTSSGSSNSGTGGAASSAGVAVPPDSHCTTTSSFPGWCAPKVTSCTATQDCPADWTCAAAPVAVSGQSGSGTAGAADIAPGAPVPSVPTTPATMTCTSPLGGYNLAKDVGGTGPTNTGTSTGAGGTSGSGTTEPPRAAGTPGGASSSGCALGGRPSGSLAGLAALALLGLAMARRRR